MRFWIRSLVGTMRKENSAQHEETKSAVVCECESGVVVVCVESRLLT